MTNEEVQELAEGNELHRFAPGRCRDWIVLEMNPRPPLVAPMGSGDPKEWVQMAGPVVDEFHLPGDCPQR